MLFEKKIKTSHIDTLKREFHIIRERSRTKSSISL